MFALTIAATMALICQATHSKTEHAVTVEVRDLVRDTAVPGVSLALAVPVGESLRAITDANGEARFKFSLPEGRRYFSLSAERDGLVPLFYRWLHGADSPAPPNRILLQTEKATAIGGRVLDEDGRTLADAVVVASVKKSYPRSKQMVGVREERARTDADGRWSLKNVPAQLESIELAAYHYLCLDENDCYQQQPFKPLSTLRDGSAVLRLQRGTRVEGTVLSPDGKPVAGAEVAYGEGRGYGNAIPPVKSDDKGRFTFGIKPGTVASLVSQAPGFGPVLHQVRVGDGPSRVDLTLPQAHWVRGRVLDPAGKPIAKASVALYWKGNENVPRDSHGAAAGRALETDSGGRFEWKDAPRSGVQADISADGFTARNNVPITSDLDQKFELTPPTPVKGTVVDADTGKPIDAFSLVLAAAWQEDSAFIWQGAMNDEAQRTTGSFQTTFSSPAYRYLIRVQADGYFAEDSEPFATDGKLHTLTYRLTRGKPHCGTVCNPDGSIAREGFVALVPVHRDGWIDYLDYPRDVEAGRRQRAAGATIGSDGRFSLPPQRDRVALLVLTDAGSLLVLPSELRDEDRLVVQPWARVAGKVTIDGKPAARIRLQSYDPDESAPVEGAPRLLRRYWTDTDDMGRFELNRILPGKLTLAQWVPNGVQGRSWPVVRASVDVAGGGSYELKIGESGRAVTGRLVLPTDNVWMIRKSEIVPRNAKAGRAESFGVEVLEQGRLRALDLRPGDYTLHVALHEPPPAESCGWGRLLAEFKHDFTIRDVAPTDAAPFDLGTLKPITIGGVPLEVGDVAPDFRLKTLDGRDLKMADLQGKYVLLDFWATWCAPCVAELPNLSRVRNEFSSDKRFALIGINVDERTGDVASMVKSMKLAWPQALAGSDWPGSSDYGATALPATFLIGPDGKILAKDLRGEAVRKAVAQALR